ncbi:Flp family type IVb pilin [Ralstonia solanacearum species complex bacterium KE056]|uniref:Flp family type IVb pilin n=1 Tax=Ralstonia solanacearum species complex TaxID=3116862 RepID=UPI0001D9514A|nr:Flp family type IVb pilin [Ralstonia pseudosolanacearum]CBJ39015.1 putative pilin transmembrane protein [Ralstonia solanacearum CMR15]
MNTVIQRFIREEDGAASTEYALLVTFVALVMIAYGDALQGTVKSAWSQIAAAF